MIVVQMLHYMAPMYIYTFIYVSDTYHLLTTLMYVYIFGVMIWFHKIYVSLHYKLLQS